MFMDQENAKETLTFQEPKEVSCGRCLYEDKAERRKSLENQAMGIIYTSTHFIGDR